MNAEQAKAISIVDFLHRLGHSPTKPITHEAWYLSPYRDENTASFHVHIRKNIWHDFGDEKGGSIIDLAIEILKAQGKPCSVSDGLQFLAQADQSGPLVKVAPVDNGIREEASLILTKIGPIQDKALKNYLAARGISLKAARLNMTEAKVYNRKSKRHFVALAMKNEDGGHELRNLYFKGCVGPKDITVIRGSDPARRGFHVFEGSFDYETVLVMNKDKPLKDDSYILHSVSNLAMMIPFIKGFGYRIGYTWMDNDKAGKKARLKLVELFRAEHRLFHRPMNRLYCPHKDPNAWHMARHGLAF